MTAPKISLVKFVSFCQKTKFTMIAAGMTALFMMASTPLSTSQAPLFHIKYPTPLATMPSHKSTKICVEVSENLAGLPRVRSATTATKNAPK